MVPLVGIIDKLPPVEGELVKRFKLNPYAGVVCAVPTVLNPATDLSCDCCTGGFGANSSAAKPALSFCPSRCAARHHLCLDHTTPGCHEPDPHHPGLFVCGCHFTTAPRPLDLDRALRLHFPAHADAWPKGSSVSL